MDKLGLKGFLTSMAGFSEPVANMVQMHIISRAVFPGSEHKTAQWIKDNSSVSGLCQVPINKVDRYKLYSASKSLYQNKDRIEVNERDNDESQDKYWGGFAGVCFAFRSG